MLVWPTTALIIALIVGILGFDGATVTALGIARILFFVSIVLLLIAALMGHGDERPLRWREEPRRNRGPNRW
jgi:uncharacterized membrane protein YtjA (UPF0391 family)